MTQKGVGEMEKTAILYQSKYGAARKYAEMLREALGCESYDLKRQGCPDLAPYRCLVFAGGIYAGGVAGLSVLRKKYPQLKGKRLAVFCVGASPYDEKTLEQLRNRCLKGELSRIPLFYGRGAWNESVMSGPDRFLCGMLQKSVARQDPSTLEPWARALLEASGKACDWSDKAYLEPLLRFLREEA